MDNSGIDARAINSFHELRERKPGYFKHRFINYGWYGVLGTYLCYS